MLQAITRASGVTNNAPVVPVAPPRSFRPPAVNQVKFDLVISDVVMPGTSGVELERRLQLEHPSLKVVLVSGYAEDAFARHGIDETDVPGLLRKPLTLRTLGKKVFNSLRGVV